MFYQLAQDPDNGCEPLGKQGARGALFRLTLDSYGYTFVAKGTVWAFKANLKHEGLVYRHLNEIQGELIPVYLGNISLAYPYFLDVGVRIVHMLLMSWAGEQAQKDLMSSLGRDINEETTCAVTKLRYHGVEHHDVRPPNVLWNSEGGNVMLVDFERSEILKRAPALQEISPNLKRRRLHSNEEVSSGGPSRMSFVESTSFKESLTSSFSIAMNSELFSSSVCISAGKDCHNSGLRDRVLSRNKSLNDFL